jgi:alkaline phosphatase
LASDRLDRIVFPENLKNLKNSPKGDNKPASDQPGLKDMTIKAIDILQKRSHKKKSGWFLMSEAASVDKVTSFFFWLSEKTKHVMGDFWLMD